MPVNRTRTTYRYRSAFTLIEVIAVLLVAGIVVGLIAPRVSTSTRRSTENSVRAASSMLAIVAQRAASSSELSALVYDHEEGSLFVEVLRQQRGNYDRTERVWRRDPFAPEVVLSGCRVSSFVTDGLRVSEDSFRLVFEPGVTRPQISMTIAESTSGATRTAVDGGRTWQIDLPAYALRPVVTGLLSEPTVRDVPEPIDLDQLGRVEQDW